MADAQGVGDLDPIDAAYYGDQIKPGVQLVNDRKGATASEVGTRGDADTILIDLQQVRADASALAFNISVFRFVS